MTLKPENSKPQKIDHTSFTVFFKAIILGFKLIFWEWQVFVITIVYAGLMIGYEIATMHIFVINGQFVKALTGSDYNLFVACVWAGIKSALLRASLQTAKSIASEVCSITYRRNAYERAHQKYLGYNTYYRLNCIDKENVDNPDQRITGDISGISSFIAYNGIEMLTAMPFSLIFYSIKIYKVADWEGIATLYGIALGGILINLVLLKPVGRWINRIERGEGGFRYKHSTIRDHAESTAMYNAAKFENDECCRLYDKILIKNAWLACWQFPQELIKNFLGTNEYLMCSLILYYPLIVESRDVPDIMEFTILTLYQGHYLYGSINALSNKIVQLFDRAGTLRRVHEFCTFTDKHWMVSVNESVNVDSHIEFHNDTKYVFKFDSVCYTTPIVPYKVLMTELNLSLKRGENLLLSGPSGCGKSAFLRVISRLWKIQSGTLTIGISDQEMLVLPQKPYFPTGNLTLRQQIIFPKLIDDKEVLNEELVEFMKNLQLDSVLEKCGGLDAPVDFEWHERFTPAELQQIAFIRVLYHQPKLVLMDDVSSCCSAAVEQRLYELLDGLGISYISAGNRVSLRAFHHKELKLHGDSTYEVVDLRDDPIV